MSMKKNIWLVAGVAGMFFAHTPTVAKAEFDPRIGIEERERQRPGFFIDRRPEFIYLEERGFSVSVNGPYDIVYYGNRYYLHRDRSWYVSRDYRGGWRLIMDYELPYRVRRYRHDMWRFRDSEYRRHDRRYWDDTNRRYDRYYRDGARYDDRGIDAPRDGDIRREGDGRGVR